MRMNLFLVGLLGGCSGLRTFLPLAVLCWFAWHKMLHVSGWRGFVAYLATAAVATALALGELGGDKHPKAPPRIAPQALIPRLVAGAFLGLVLAQPLLLSAAAAVAAGVVGAIAGTFGGWFVRTRSVAALKCPDWMVAVTEDAVTVALSIAFLHIVAIHGTLFLGNEGFWMSR